MPRTESDLPAFDADAEAFTYDAWHGYWHLARQGTPPAYPFGFGLSYTTFVLEAASAEVGDGGIRVSGVASGTRAGAAAPTSSRSTRTGRDPTGPTGWSDSSGVELAAGETAGLRLVIPLTTLAERDVDTHSMVVRPGSYLVRVARNASDDGIATRVTVGG